MTSTELTLNRTLTDILEDELYNLHTSHGCGPEHCHSSNVSLNGKSLMNLPLPAFEEFMTNETLATDFNLSPPYQGDLLTGSSNFKHALLNESQSNGNELFSNTTQSNQLTQSSGHQQPQSEEFRIFNKYADPSLTTTSSHNGKAQDKAPSTPVQKTVNLHSIMKVPNPFNTMQIPRVHPQAPSVSPDIKVTHNTIDCPENIYAPDADDEFLGYEDNYDLKMNWPLQDNNLALSNADARMIFDNEFQHDDDLSDDEDDDENAMVDNSKNDFFKVPFGYLNEFNVDGKMKHMSDGSFVDSDVMSSNMSSDDVVLDDDEDDSNMLDEDDLYEPSLKNNRKESVVFSCVTPVNPVNDKVGHTYSIEQEKRGRERDRDIPSHQEQPIKKPLSRRNLSNTQNDSVNTSRKRPSTFKKADLSQSSQSLIKSQQSSHCNSQSPSPSQPYAKHRNNDGSEVYTCIIVNAITKQTCSAQFSRSYDLTRHQNTIHAKKKSVFRCSECIKSLGHEGYQKTFSRLDALTRHIKSKHEYLTLEQRQDITKYARDNMGFVVA